MKNKYINEVFEKGYEIAVVNELTYACKKTNKEFTIRDSETVMHFLDDDFIGRISNIQETKKSIKYFYYYCDGEKGVRELPPISELKLINSNKITTLVPIYSTITEIEVNLLNFKEDLQRTSIKLIRNNNQDINNSIETLINKYGTLQNRIAINDEIFFDNEYNLWCLLLKKLIPSVSTFINNDLTMTLDELNQCFAGVSPVYDDINNNAFKLKSTNLLGAISMLLKTSNLRKPPIINCLNCGKEINQKQGGGRPMKFCKNNNRCKMQFYRRN